MSLLKQGPTRVSALDSNNATALAAHNQTLPAAGNDTAVHTPAATAANASSESGAANDHMQTALNDWVVSLAGNGNASAGSSNSMTSVDNSGDKEADDEAAAQEEERKKKEEEEKKKKEEEEAAKKRKWDEEQKKKEEAERKARDSRGRSWGVVFVGCGAFRAVHTIAHRLTPPCMPAERHKYEPAELPKPKEDASVSSSCAQALQLPQVALLFLTKGDLYHPTMWKLWFESAIGKLPRHALNAATCGADGKNLSASVLEKCGALPRGRDDLETLIDAQHLFTVYVHAPPNMDSSEMSALFRGRRVERRIIPGWGTHKLVEAARNLLLDAWRDPLNARFLMASESDIPIYDPLTFYAQMMSEEGSRVNGCAHARTDRRRWSWRMRSAHLRAYHWRKSSQWFMLTREHARVVLEDEEIYRKFEQWCWQDYDPDYHRHRDCYSDEHYMPTLFAVKGIQTESNCGAIGVAATLWRGGPHPRSFSSNEIKPSFIQEELRTPDVGCDAESAWQEAQAWFADVNATIASREEFCKEPLPSYGSHLTPLCKVTARKFTKDVADDVLRLFADCTNGLHLLAPSVCEAVAAEEEAIAAEQEREA